MTVVENLNPKVQYIGPFDINDILPITFPYIDTDDVLCKSNETNLVFNVNYKVEGNNVILLTKIEAGVTVTIYRSTPLDQQAEFPQNNRFNSSKLNTSLDKLCMQQQEQQEKISRSLKVPISTEKSFNGNLPPLIANRALKVNKDASGFDFSEYNPDDITDETKGFMERAEKAAIDAEASNQSAIEQAQIATGKAQEATNIVESFDAHAAEKQNAFDVNAATLTARYDNNDLAKTNAFNQNAQDMTDGFNTNVMLKMDDFDAHAMEKEIAFDDNAAAKQALVDASANAAKISEDNAKLSETNSAESERKSQVWAEGEDPDVANLGGTHSAKKWAEIAGSIVGEGVIQDNIVSLKTTYSSDKLEKHFAVNEDHDSVLDCLDVLDSTINAKTTVPLSSLLAIDSDARPSHKAKGAEVYDEFGTMGIIDSVTDTEAVIITKESREKIKVVDTLDIQQNGFGQYYVALTANEIRNEIIKGKIVQLSFDDVITNTGEQIYEFETFTKDNYAVFRRNVITEDKAERINIKVDYQGIVTFDPVSYKALDYKNITNCITEIPQDIKLEKTETGLVLRSGSKVYKADGTSYVVDTDKTITVTPDNDLTIFMKIDGGLYYNATTFQTFSGDIAPTTSQTAYTWFDTKNNKVIPYSQSAPIGEAYLPLGTYKKDKTLQVFNGFGYIGSTMFSLPGVKGLAPRGRNKDGSLKNEFFTKTKVETYTFTGSATANCKIQISSAKTASANMDTVNWKYDEKANYITYKGIIQSEALVGNLRVENSRVVRFEAPTVFRALNYSDKSDITSWGMPSNKFVDLALGVNEAKYTAPGNGHFYLCKRANADQRITMLLGSSRSSQARDGAIATSRTSNLPIFVSQKCKRGEAVYVGYTASGETEAFRFVYAEGEV